MGDEKKSVWNSLEIAKLLVTPLTAAVLGYFVQSTLAGDSQTWQQSQRIVERRIAVYDAIRKDLNKIYCFVEDVGDWRSETPDSIIGYKRKVDAEMYTQQAFWSSETFIAYQAYMRAAFGEYEGKSGEDATIKANLKEKKAGIPGWRAEWDKRLSGKSSNHRRDYESLQKFLTLDLGAAVAARSGGS